MTNKARHALLEVSRCRCMQDKVPWLSSKLYKAWFAPLVGTLLNRRFLVDYLFNRLFNHSATGRWFVRAQPSYPFETTCSQCALPIETHTEENTSKNEQ